MMMRVTCHCVIFPQASGINQVSWDAGGKADDLRVLNITILVLLECRTSASLAATMLIDQAEAAAGGHFYSSDENFYLFLIGAVLAWLIFVEQF